MENIPKNFSLIKELGQGGMAIIYKVRDKNDGKIYALKMHKNNNSYSYADEKRFKNEIGLMKTIDSKHVVKIYDYKYEKNSKYILMEYIDGPTLKNYIATKNNLTPTDAVDKIIQLCKGFNHIHYKKIIHRDIKASNIIVSSHGVVKIIDFGIGLSDSVDRVTKESNIIGSPHYISPELTRGEESTYQSDIYSLGILLYEMLLGETPYKGYSTMDILNMHKNKDVPHVNKIFQNIPQSLANVVIKATARDVKNRYKTMQEFLEDVETSLVVKRYNEEVTRFNKKAIWTIGDFLLSKYGLGIIVIFLLTLAGSVIYLFLGG